MSRESHPPDEDAAPPADAAAEQETGEDAGPDDGGDSNPGQKGERETPLGGI